MSNLLNSFFYKLERECQPHHEPGSQTDHPHLEEPPFCREVFVIILFRPKLKTVSIGVVTWDLHFRENSSQIIVILYL